MIRYTKLVEEDDRLHNAGRNSNMNKEMYAQVRDFDVWRLVAQHTFRYDDVR